MHACRHTYCSWGLMSGMNMMALAQNLGHADTRQIERVYGHLTVTVRREPSCADRAVEGRLEAPMQATVLAPVQETVRWRELR
jgi:hypothetical protein